MGGTGSCVEPGLVWNLIWCGTGSCVEPGLVWNRISDPVRPLSDPVGVASGHGWNRIWCGTGSGVEPGLVWNRVWCGTGSLTRCDHSLFKSKSRPPPPDKLFAPSLPVPGEKKTRTWNPDRDPCEATSFKKTFL